MPKNHEKVYLTNSGTEAIEGALKLAKKATGRSELIGAYKSYHGSSHGALSLLGLDSQKKDMARFYLTSILLDLMKKKI